MREKYQVVYLYNKDLKFLSNLLKASLVLIKKEDLNDHLINFLEQRKINYEVIEKMPYDLIDLKNKSSLEIAKESDKNKGITLGIFDLEVKLEQVKSSILDGFLVTDDRNISEALEMAKKVFFNPINYDLFIVDFDGTIIDSMKMWEDVCFKYLESHNIFIDKAFFNRIYAKTNREIAKIFRDEFFKDLTLEEMEKSLFDFIGNAYLDCKIKANAIELLQSLKQNGKVILYSATAQVLIENLVKYHHLEKYFDGIYSGSELNLTKADGSGFKYFASLNKDLKPLIIEDSLHAIKGAKMVNIPVLAVSDYMNKKDFSEIINLSKYFISLNRG